MYNYSIRAVNNWRLLEVEHNITGTSYGQTNEVYTATQVLTVTKEINV